MCCGLGQEGVASGWRGLSEIVGGTEKRGGEAKILKKKGQAGSGDGYLKKRGVLEPPYQTMMFASTL